MKWLTFEIQRAPGFRFNLIDLGLITGLAGLSLLLYRLLPEETFFLIPLYVGFSFFLFCNVFRIGNALERVWYVVFILLAAYGLHRPDRLWPLVLLVCEPLKASLILYRIIRGPYVGVFSPHRQGNIPNCQGER
ncbi:MAG: hypothetical protein AB1641_14215 [Thermodesulfobacteriota bacterium]